MAKKSGWFVALAMAFGCTPAATVTPSMSAETTYGSTGSSTEVLASPYRAEDSVALSDAVMPSYEEDMRVLPDAPWSSGAVLAEDLPVNVRATLASAENAAECQPMLPAGATTAPARATTLDGGWAMEFDQRGAPGVRANGRLCTRCGRGSFGIAGTAMPADSIADLETGEMPLAVFNDGSTQSVEAEEGVASAILTVGGQDCVYQVWTFLGEEHLSTLLEELRFVQADVSATDAVASAH